jgi:hypothetical protein
MESTVENILAPAVRVVLVDVVNAAISDHDFVGRGWETRVSYCEEGSSWSLVGACKYSRRLAWGSVTTYPRKMSGSGYVADMIRASSVAFSVEWCLPLSRISQIRDGSML